jgi:hypothetical protein
MLVSHDSVVAQGKDITAKVLEKLISPLQSVHESCPNFVILQLECKDADFGDEHLRFCDFALPQAFPMRRQKGQKDLLQFHREFLQASMPMAEGDWGKARLCPGGRGSKGVWRQSAVERRAAQPCCLVAVLSLLCRHRLFLPR